MLSTQRFCGDCGECINRVAAYCTGCGASQEEYGTVAVPIPLAAAPVSSPLMAPARSAPPMLTPPVPAQPPVLRQPVSSTASARVLEPHPADLELAPLGVRFVASMIDAVLESIVSYAFVLVLIGGLLGADVGVAAFVVLLLVGLAAGSLIPAWFLSRKGARNGQSIGKQIMNIRVVMEGGGPLSAGTAVIRETILRRLVFGLIGLLFLFIPTLVNAIWPLCDSSRRALHDKGAGTVVVRA